jgi:hypothetical protein
MKAIILICLFGLVIAFLLHFDGHRNGAFWVALATVALGCTAIIAVRFTSR